MSGIIAKSDLINKSFFGDCLDVMPSLPEKVYDMVLADLPFGTTKCDWDSIIDLPKMWKCLDRIVKPNAPILLFAQTPFDKVLGSSNLSMLRYEWIWEKTEATGFFNAKKMPLKAHENILVFYKKLPFYEPLKTTGHSPVNTFTKKASVQNRTSVYGKSSTDIKGGGSTDRYPRSVILFPTEKQVNKNNDTIFSTQKPVGLLSYFIKTYSKPNDLILDMCAGSGTTGEAAFINGRNYTMIEKYDSQMRLIRSRERKFKNSLFGDKIK